jgi:hypothetical protein
MGLRLSSIAAEVMRSAWFDVLELRLDYALDATVFTMKMLQPASQQHPRLFLSAGAI